MTTKKINTTNDKGQHNTQGSDIYTYVRDKIVNAIEAGTENFQMPWHVTDANCLTPLNAFSRKPYRGINILTLWAAAAAHHYPSGMWATYRQWQQLGAQVRRGETATMIVLWKPTERPTDDEDNDDAAVSTKNRGSLLARGYFVFNSAQVDGFIEPDRPQLSESERIATAEQFFLRVLADVQHGGSRAFYDAEQDRIYLPLFADFRDGFGYYSTFAHELTHWTGAKSRLDRDLGRRFADDAYAMEELVAELGAAFLCAYLELSPEPRADHAAYIADWLRVLRNDKKAIFTAASKAQQAVDWLLAAGERNQPSLFETGQVLITPAAREALGQSDVLGALHRHRHGDWGDIDADDWQENRRSLNQAGRLFSVYHATNGEKFYVITEWDRSVTTILLPADY